MWRAVGKRLDNFVRSQLRAASNTGFAKTGRFAANHACLTRLTPPSTRCSALGAAAAVGGLGLHSSCDGADAVEAEPTQAEVKKLLESLQQHFVAELEALPPTTHEVLERLYRELRPLESLSRPLPKLPGTFHPVEWKRDQGVHGGGRRFETSESFTFNRASVNVSAVHYEDKLKSPVNSATALSVILHPQNPYAPSMHFHISWMQPKKGKGYWRMIADLNPAIVNPQHTAQFDAALDKVVPEGLLAPSREFGDKYFFIPALGRSRGVSHFFAAKIDTDVMSTESTMEFACELATTAIAQYTQFVRDAINKHPDVSLTAEDKRKQLDYHTLYMFQVLTMDKGTTFGLLAHSDNDVGTLGSLPCKVDRGLLASWRPEMPEVQQLLLDDVLEALSDETPCVVSPETRAALAEVVRQHYTNRREGIKHQAEMDMAGWASAMAPSQPSEHGTLSATEQECFFAFVDRQEAKTRGMNVT